MATRDVSVAPEPCRARGLAGRAVFADGFGHEPGGAAGATTPPLLGPVYRAGFVAADSGSGVGPGLWNSCSRCARTISTSAARLRRGPTT